MADKDTTVVPDLGGGAVYSEDVSKLAGLLTGANEADDDKEDSTELTPGSDDDAPVERRASGEDKDRDEPEDTPAIEAPASWDAEARKRFAKLDADTQQFIIARETEREKGINSKLQEVAKEREAITAKQTGIDQLRSAYEQRLIAVAKHLESTIPEEFKVIKSQADLTQIAAKDPALAARFMAFQQQAAGVMSELQQIQADRQVEAQSKHRDYLAKEHEALAKVWPEFVDAAKGGAIKSELSAYAKERGFNEQEISGLADHRLVMVLRDAVEGRKALSALDKAKAKADKATPAKVARPGQGEQSRGNGLDRASLMTAVRSGNTDKQVAAIARILNG